MNLDRLYDLAEAENIKIYDYCINEDINGMFLNYDKLNAIALNYKNFENSYEEKCVLSEELAHYYMDAIYNYRNTDKELYYKQEYRAMKYSINMLIPFEDLKLAIKKRYEYNF